jgi:hypothetical protein
MPDASKRLASVRRRVRRPRPANAHLSRVKQAQNKTAALETSWRAINVARDAKGLAMARDGVVLRDNAILGRLLQCSAASLEGKSVFGDLLARPRGKTCAKQ